MNLKFLPKDTWMVAKIAAQVECISIHATSQEALAECARRNTGNEGSYCALVKVKRLGASLTELRRAARLV